jgi:hypothetical protein
MLPNACANVANCAGGFDLMLSQLKKELDLVKLALYIQV